MEGRSDSVFDPWEYLTFYPDLRVIFGTDPRRGALHWYNFGYGEGRLGTVPPGFDAVGYLTFWPDVAAVFGNTAPAAWSHYWNFGLFELRYFDNEFRANEYLALYPDLQAAFGPTNLRAAAVHWLTFGKAEGRQGRY